jgi:hypothetical protein
MAYYSRNMTQVATYFPPAGRNGFGDLSFGAAVSLNVRWQDKADLFRDTQGREVVSSAIVYLPQAIAVGGRLGLGTLTDPNDAREIRNVGESPSLDGKVTLVKAWL